ncbi:MULTISPECIES: hypothetical protein [unclassified Bacillus (in: firmicutes)]|uniref:hypothetical protein n=1 Tax=unclassified Bacillus (in: firmicutes) TaxID=185979 RepID=UPI001BE8B413|nr:MULTISPECIES: hypothetical protein [unclassified Bacillus (in: firmicutes)]MBT2640580.1 hypothetical protein [Bacillus sp. ISL-39]MBT2663480.1 hypothetical protein [Bacillus sp. ISL-45]
MDSQEIVKMIQKLNEKIDSLQKSDFHFHIEKVTVEHLQLEELAYHLDKIDIKELSGMMNLGNSFSPNLETIKSQSKNSMEKKPEKDRDEPTYSSKSHEGERAEPALSVIINGKEILSE